jgi:DNA-binding response OmpR family regulator
MEGNVWIISAAWRPMMIARFMPALLLLDLKMPRLDGFEVLAWLGEQPALLKLPVVVLSSSSDDSDIFKARQLGAREYIVKPLSLPDLVKAIRGLHDRWLTSPHEQQITVTAR